MNFLITSDKDIPVKLMLYFTDGLTFPVQIKYLTPGQYPNRKWLSQDNYYECNISVVGRKGSEVESLTIDYWDAVSGEDRTVRIVPVVTATGNLANISLHSGRSYWAQKLHEKALEAPEK